MVHKVKTVCIMSGGLDSVCFYAYLANSGSELYTVTFDYHQRAIPEISRAKYFAKIVGSKDHKVVDISFMRELYGKSNSLTDKKVAIGASFTRDLIVPIRNAVFLTIGAAWAMSIGASKVAYGAHLDDIQHYSDCRPQFARSLQHALNLADVDSISAGDRQSIEIISPAIKKMDKTMTLQEGYRILGSKLFRTWSCYSPGVRIGNRLMHCGKCESCINRKVAFQSARIKDKTGYARE